MLTDTSLFATTTAAYVIVGVVAAIAVILASTLPVVVIGRQTRKQRAFDAETRSREREEDWARQDEVAARQEEAAKAVREVAAKADETAAHLLERQDVSDAQQAEVASKLAEAQDAIATKVAEVADTAAATAAATDVKLGEIKVVADQTHLLVNSNMMKEMRKGTASLRAQAVLMRRSVVRDKADGIETPLEDTDALSALEIEIADSEKALADLTLRTEEAAKVAEAAA